MRNPGNGLQAETQPVASPVAVSQYTTLLMLSDLWATVTCAFQKAAQLSTSPVEYFYQIDGQVICLRFANKKLADLLTPALSHLAIEPHFTPALTIKLWDSATTGIGLPPLPSPMQQSPPAQAQWGSYVHSERFRAFFQPSFQIFTMLDSQRNEAIYWVQDTNQLPLAEGGAPLLTLLHWWLGRQGRQIVHGAAVGTEKGGVLLAGKSGSGKSTTALACLHAGLHYLGDDYCLVAATPQPTVHSLYTSGKVHFADLARFPRFQLAQSTIRYADADKALYFFADPFAAQIVPSLPLKAVFLPQISPNAESAVSLVSPAVALLAIGPSTVFQLIGEKSQTMHHLGQLVRQLPCYRLTLGADIAYLPVLITNLLATL